MMQKLKSVKQEQETNAQCHLQELTESKERLLAELDQSVAEQQVTFSLIWSQYYYNLLILYFYGNSHLLGRIMTTIILFLGCSILHFCSCRLKCFSMENNCSAWNNVDKFNSQYYYMVKMPITVFLWPFNAVVYKCNPSHFPNKLQKKVIKKCGKSALTLKSQIFTDKIVFNRMLICF